jgi:glycosyltransferase involved in cell wall biosynthesis
MREPTFSVVLTTYCRPALLAEAVASVLRQTIRDFELVVVDDGSVPPAVVPDDERIRVVVHGENRGLPAARNAGWDRARGDFIVFLDDDDLFTPRRLEFAARGLARAPVSTCWSKFLDGPERRGRVLEGDVGDTVLDALTPPAGATAVRRNVSVRFDVRWNAVEDVDWWLRVTQQHPVSTVTETGLLIRRHAGLRWRNGLAERARENLALLDAHADYFGSRPKAAAFRLRRAGLLALTSGDRQLARAAFARSLRIEPRPETLWHLTRSVAPTRPIGRATPQTDST